MKRSLKFLLILIVAVPAWADLPSRRHFSDQAALDFTALQQIKNPVEFRSALLGGAYEGPVETYMETVLTNPDYIRDLLQRKSGVTDTLRRNILLLVTDWIVHERIYLRSIKRAMTRDEVHRFTLPLFAILRDDREESFLRKLFYQQFSTKILSKIREHELTSNVRISLAFARKKGGPAVTPTIESVLLLMDTIPETVKRLSKWMPGTRVQVDAREDLSLIRYRLLEALLNETEGAQLDPEVRTVVADYLLDKDERVARLARDILIENPSRSKVRSVIRPAHILAEPTVKRLLEILKIRGLAPVSHALILEIIETNERMPFFGDSPYVDPDVLAALRNSLGDSNVRIRRYAARALQSIMTVDETTQLALVVALRDEDVWVRRAAASALGATASAPSDRRIDSSAVKLALMELLNELFENPQRDAHGEVQAWIIRLLMRNRPETLSVLHRLLVTYLAAPATRQPMLYEALLRQEGLSAAEAESADRISLMTDLFQMVERSAGNPKIGTLAINTMGRLELSAGDILQLLAEIPVGVPMETFCRFIETKVSRDMLMRVVNREESDEAISRALSTAGAVKALLAAFAKHEIVFRPFHGRVYAKLIELLADETLVLETRRQIIDIFNGIINVRTRWKQLPDTEETLTPLMRALGALRVTGQGQVARLKKNLLDVIRVRRDNLQCVQNFVDAGEESE